MSKKVKINGSWVVVKDEDVVEGEETQKTPEELEAERVAAEAAANGEGGDEGADKALMRQAKKIGEEIAKSTIANLDLGGTSKLAKKVEKFLDQGYGTDSKLKEILHGKDLFGGEELTKDEKIIGFFHALVTKNHMALKALAEGAGADGGYLFPNEFLGELIRDLPEINVMRQYVRIIPMRRDSMDITSLVDGLDVFWTAENATKSTTTARFGTATLTAKKMAAIIYSSDELIEDSTEIDVVALIIQLFAEAIGEEEERVIWAGNGTTEPGGIETARAAGTISTVGATGNVVNDLNTLFYRLPRKYRVNANWFMNDNTARNIDGLVDSTGRPIWQINVADATVPQIKGKTVVISDPIPNRTIFFGDMKKGYFLGDRKSMTVKISNDTETAFTKDQTAIRVVSRIGGLVALPAAIRAMNNF